MCMCFLFGILLLGFLLLLLQETETPLEGLKLLEYQC